MIVLKELRYEVDILNKLYFMFSLLLLIFLPFLVFFKVGSKTAYYFGLTSFSLFIPVGVCFRMMNVWQDRLHKISLMVVAIILFSLAICGEDIFLTCTISKLVKPDIQTTADGVRLILCMFGSIVATGSITFVEKHTNLLLMGLLILLILSIVLVVKRRKTLMKPHAIV